jgi:beta-galactosidase/beta-glucuronidase
MRDTFLSLDGSWRFAFDDEDVGFAERWFEYGHELPLTIQVPFAYQCEMSGVHGDIGGDVIHPVIWYRRGFTVPDEMSGQRVFVKFIAVDWACTVWVNGVYVGSHEGGYTPFACDITSVLHSDPTQENDLCLRVVDQPDMAQPRGKQYWRRGLMGCWYTPVSGIWQSVYLESVAIGSPMITRVHVTPDVDKGTAAIAVSLDRAPAEPLSITFGMDMTVEDGVAPDRPALLTASMKEREASFTADMRGAAHDDPFGGVRCWSPEHPNLYGLTVEIGGDRVHTYFGMRKIEARDGEAFLNNAPLRQRLVLDQGYWPKSNLTAIFCYSYFSVFNKIRSVFIVNIISVAHYGSYKENC